MAGVAELVDVGVTNVYVNIASFAPGPADAPAVLKVLVDEFRTVTA
jgi:hydroxylamine reductase (hybrid-cluster protein)